MTKLDHALRLAAEGFRVFPLLANGKTPAVSNWQNIATTDVSQIRQWWSQWPEANIGTPTSGLVVIDVDPRKGGEDSFVALCAQIQLTEEIVKTRRARTQGGGDHIYYRLPEHTHVRGGNDLLGPGLDVKSYGGYVVAPGSTIDGRPYEWANERPIAEAPAWLVERCKARRPRLDAAGKRLINENDAAIERASAYLTEAPEAIEGERGDETCFRVAARLFDFGVSRETCLELMREWNDHKAFPPFDDEALQEKVGSAERNRQQPIGHDNPEFCPFAPVELTLATSPWEGEVRQLAVDDLLTFDDAIVAAIDEGGEPLVEGVVDRGTFSVWYGPPKGGKTFVVLYLAFCVAAGLEWAGRKTRQGPVLYVAGEGGRGILRRLRALHLRHPEARGVPLFVLRRPVDLLHGKQGPELLAAKCAEIERRCGQKVELVVVDTIARALAGGDENSPTDMGALVKNMDAIRGRTGAHMLGVHHTGKDVSRGARGHSSLLGAVDTEIRISDKTITATAQRDLEDDFAMAFDLKPVSVGELNGQHVKTCIAVIRQKTEHNIEATGAEKEVLRAAATFSGIFGWQAIARTMRQKRGNGVSEKGLSRATVSEHLLALSDKRLILKHEDNQYTYVSETCRNASESDVSDVSVHPRGPTSDIRSNGHG